MNEFLFIEKLKAKLARPSDRTILGIGDDTAILKPFASSMLWTVDAQVEGVHFDLSYALPEEVGHKALAVNLSDIAAMGGVARAAVISIGVRAGLTEVFWESVYDGISQLAQRWDVDVVGGNVTSTSGPLFIDISVLGESNRPIRRDGAKAGDTIFVTGELGGAALGLRELLKDPTKAREGHAGWVKRQLKPEARLAEAGILAEFGRVSSLVDISDGLSSDLGHLAEASGVGFEVDSQKLPMEQGADLDLAVSGGEDYELLGTVAAKDWAELKALFDRRNLKISPIGRVLSGDERTLIHGSRRLEMNATGWNHLLKLT